jgi:hypothetical protein
MTHSDSMFYDINMKEKRKLSSCTINDDDHDWGE